MPIDPARHSVIIVIGAVLFGLASVLDDMAKAGNRTVAGLIRSVLSALLLSVGIGMMSGGIQHFSDIPQYAPILIPTGFAVSLIASIIKNQIKLSVKRAYGVGLLILALAVPLKYSLDYLASTPTATQGDGHGHGH